MFGGGFQNLSDGIFTVIDWFVGGSCRNDYKLNYHLWTFFEIEYWTNITDVWLEYSCNNPFDAETQFEHFYCHFWPYADKLPYASLLMLDRHLRFERKDSPWNLLKKSYAMQRKLNKKLQPLSQEELPEQGGRIILNDTCFTRE